MFKVKASFACGAYYTLDLSTPPEKERMVVENLLLHFITIEVGSGSELKGGLVGDDLSFDGLYNLLVESWKVASLAEPIVT